MMDSLVLVAAANNTTVVEPSTAAPLMWLTVPLFLIALFSPAIAWRAGLIWGLTVSLADGVAGWLALRLHAYSSGPDRTIWLGLGLLSIIMLILSLAIALLRAINKYSRGLKMPKLPDIEI